MSIVVIRISGQVDVPEKIKFMLDALKLKRKYSCILLKEESDLLRKVKDYVAYGEFDETLLEKLKKKSKGEYFALPPPKGGLKKSSKLSLPKGILGNQGKEINKLLARMLYE